MGDGVTLSSTSSDPDGPLARQDWDLDNDGQFDDASAAVVSANFTRAGTYPLALRVTDSRGATSTATGQVVIRTRPILPPPPTPLLSGVVIELQGQLSRQVHEGQAAARASARGLEDHRSLPRQANCPKRHDEQSKGTKKKLRFKKLERRFRPKTKLIVTVTKNGFIGKQTTLDHATSKGASAAGPLPQPGREEGHPLSERMSGGPCTRSAWRLRGALRRLVRGG